MIQTKEVNFTYGDKVIFQSLNLTISAGESISIVGESGCGKSTLLYLLSYHQ